jgi:hypothetical protein
VKTLISQSIDPQPSLENPESKSLVAPVEVGVSQSYRSDKARCAIPSRVTSPVCRGNSGRVWVNVLLMATLTGCAARSRPQSLLPSVNIPVECATSIRFVNCDLSVNPPRCRATAITYRKGCEQVMADK